MTAASAEKFFETAAVSALVLLLCTGCSTGRDYWSDRLDDAKDVVSFTVGTGFGVKAQAGPDGRAHV